MQISSLVLSTLLGFQQPGSVVLTYEESCAQLESATAAMADVEPEAAIAALEAAIASVAAHPRELLHDAATSEAIRRARVSLAWLQLARGDQQAAADAMDAALRGAGGAPLPLDGLGPNIRKLHDERRGALESAGVATIAVDCEACDVLVDEAPASASSEHLLGTHRVWIFDSLGNIEPRYEEVVLDAADAVVTLEYRAAPQVVEKELPPPPPPEPGINPRVAKAVGGVATSLGGGLVIGGAVLLAIDNEETGNGTKAVGATLTAFGVACLVTGVTVLAVHASQKKQGRRHEAHRIAPRGLGFAF